MIMSQHGHRARLSKAKVVILGASGVGKTAFTVRYLTKRFIGEYEPNLESTYHHHATLDKEEIELEIIDTANDYSDDQLDSHVRTADGFVILYSLTEASSKRRVRYYFTLIQTLYQGDDLDFLPLVIVGNKKDLEHARTVSEYEGMELARQCSCQLHEISVAESPDDVTSVMDALLTQIKRDYLRRLASLEKRSALGNMKRVLKKKITRSKSDSVFR